MIHEAQINSPSRALFLKANQIAEAFGQDGALPALRYFISSKDELLKRPLNWLMKALRQEGRLIEIDVISKSESKYLLNQQLLELSDLHALPKLTVFHSEKRFGADLGL